MWQCPLCNGFMESQFICSHCSTTMEDAGKLSDYYAPYSPYRETDDLKITNGWADLQSQQCIHLFYCPACDHEQIGSIAEKTLQTITDEAHDETHVGLE